MLATLLAWCCLGLVVSQFQQQYQVTQSLQIIEDHPDDPIVLPAFNVQFGTLLGPAFILDWNYVELVLDFADSKIGKARSLFMRDISRSAFYVLTSIHAP